MDILQQADHHIYLSNLKLGEIRANIENQIGKIKNNLDGLSDEEYHQYQSKIGELEIFLEKLG